jgi:hypothetical protein
MVAFPSIRVGNALVHEALSVFPLVAPETTEVDYLLSEDALAKGLMTVTEVTEGGSVPNLLVDNQAESPVLFLEGEELKGAKQNRILNTSVLVAASSKTTIPVSCVEQGRWRYHARCFGLSGGHASSKLRHLLKKSLDRPLREGRGHRSDQGAVWAEVSRQMECLGSSSLTDAMEDTYDSHRNRLNEFREPLTYADGATGMAVGVGKLIVSVDVFDKPETCRRVWNRLLTGVIMDALELGPAPDRASAADAEAALDLLKSHSWQQNPAAGLGEEYRFEADGDWHAAALVFNEAVVHGSLVHA